MFTAAPIDWEQLAIQVGVLKEDLQFGGTALACDAIAEIIGADNIRRAVDYYLTYGKGAELVRSVLWHIRPLVGMERCHEIYRTDSDRRRRRAAVELLQVIADERALPWIAQLLADADESIQAYGAGVVEHLLAAEIVEREQVQDALAVMREHPNTHVRETHQFVIESLGLRAAGSASQS